MPAVAIVLGDVLPSIAPTYAMGDGPREFKPQRTSHGARVWGACVLERSDSFQLTGKAGSCVIKQ